MESIHTKLYNTTRHIFAKFAPLYLQRFVERIKERSLRRKYNSGTSTHDNEVICMLDGRVKHGGLTDRINGIISCFEAADKANRKFKIWFNCPFTLSDYLIPNEYDWIIDSKDIYFNQSSKPLYIRTINPAQRKKRGMQLLNDIIKLPNKQLHIYSNINSVESLQYHRIFHKLFKPSDKLSNILELERSRIGTKYISATFRFQQLLNDFKEGDYKILSVKEREKLLSKCISAIEELSKDYPDKKILVTSDSPTFLDSIKSFPFVHIISGRVVHMEYNNSPDFSVHAKAFIDLYMISEAEIIHSVVINPMYESGFPKFASKINNRPFKTIIIR